MTWLRSKCCNYLSECCLCLLKWNKFCSFFSSWSHGKSSGFYITGHWTTQQRANDVQVNKNHALWTICAGGGTTRGAEFHMQWPLANFTSKQYLRLPKIPGNYRVFTRSRFSKAFATTTCLIQPNWSQVSINTTHLYGYGWFISWVYKQAVVHEDEEKNIMADRKEYSPDNRTKKTSPHKWVTVFEIFVVRILFSSSSGPGSSPGGGHFVVFLGKTLYSHSASLHPGV